MNVVADIGVSDGLSLDRQLCFAVHTCANQVARLYRSALQPIGITFTQYLVLLALWEKSPRIISELAQVLVIEPNTVTPMVKRMELLGLVSRSRHLADERQVRVSVTEQGLKLRTDVLAMQREMASRLDMRETELAEIRETVRHLSHHVAIAIREVGGFAPIVGS